MYVPATARLYMENILEGRYPFLPGVAICLEDAIRREDFPEGLENIKWFLKRWRASPGKTLLFIRPPNPAALSNIYAMDTGGLTGFILPKFTSSSLPLWEGALKKTSFLLMPTLETAEVFDYDSMKSLARQLAASSLAAQILLLRVGGNDLMQVIGIGRTSGLSIYDSALGYVLGMLCAIFLPAGFQLSAPVFGNLEDEELLALELKKDIMHGFCGKTAIHPRQLEIIREAYAPDRKELELAQTIMESKQAVFRHGETMCEPAVQFSWAGKIMQRYKIFGIKGDANGDKSD